jgi:hypothetical protein
VTTPDIAVTNTFSQPVYVDPKLCYFEKKADGQENPNIALLSSIYLSDYP